MSIGLTGSHRVGKTTLAKAFAKKSGVAFVETSVSKVFEDMGFNPKLDYPLATRIEIQKRVLDVVAGVYAKTAAPFITDRTPVDMMAYLLADVQRETTDAAQGQAVMDYLDACAFVTNRYFTSLIVVQPGIALVEEAGKAPANPAYIEHINSLIMGLVVSERIQTPHFYIPRSTTRLDARIESVEYVTRNTVERHNSFLAQAVERGQPIVFH